MLVPSNMNGKQLMNVNYRAFDIEQNKMKMNMPLDMNGKQLLNINLNLKFGDIFKVIKCDTRYSNDTRSFLLVRKDNHHFLSFSVPVIQ